MITPTEENIREIVSDPELEEDIRDLLMPHWVNAKVLSLIDAIDKIRSMYPGLSSLRKRNDSIVFIKPPFGKVG